LAGKVLALRLESLTARHERVALVPDDGKVASAGSAQLVFSSSWVKNVFARMPVPFTVFAKTPNAPPGGMIDVANELVEKTAKKLTEKGVKVGLKAGMRGSSSVAPTTTSSGFADEVPIEDTFLLNFGIVNMQKGIGHGW
jgi:hypothetical protein